MVEALNGTEQPRGGAGLKVWLFNPFLYVAGGLSLVIGLVAILLAGYIGSFSNTHFDGALDVHTGAAVPLHVFLLEGIIAWLSLAIVLLIIGKLVSKTAFRSVDLIGTQAMARWPTVIIALVTLIPQFQRFLPVLVQSLMSPGSGARLPLVDGIVFAFVVLIMMLAIIWMVALMYRSFSICCNIRGAKGAGWFVVGVVIAEVVSKVALWKLLLQFPIPQIAP